MKCPNTKIEATMSTIDQKLQERMVYKKSGKFVSKTKVRINKK